MQAVAGSRRQSQAVVGSRRQSQEVTDSSRHKNTREQSQASQTHKTAASRRGSYTLSIGRYMCVNNQKVSGVHDSRCFCICSISLYRPKAYGTDPPRSVPPQSVQHRSSDPKRTAPRRTAQIRPEAYRIEAYRPEAYGTDPPRSVPPRGVWHRSAPKRTASKRTAPKRTAQIIEVGIRPDGQVTTSV